MLVGDFNVDLMKYNLAGDATDFLNALNTVGCNPLINRPTRVQKNKNASCIDQVHSKLDTGSIDNHVVLADVSDHFGTLSKIVITREIEKQKCFS